MGMQLGDKCIENPYAVSENLELFFDYNRIWILASLGSKLSKNRRVLGTAD